MNLSERYPNEMLPVRVIKLTQEQFAIIDPEDEDKVSVGHWYAGFYPSVNGYYAQREFWNSGKPTIIKMHNYIMDCKLLDHVNGNGLDNRRCKLRQVTRSQNAVNSRLRSDSTSGFKGVHWHTRDEIWEASCNRIYLGRFSDPIKAAIAADHKRIEIYGDYSHTNYSLGLVSHNECGDACPCK